MASERVLAWCREQSLFSPGEVVTAALSGGADSVAMLHLLHRLQAPLRITLHAAHFNHRLRGAEADRDEAFCRALCAQLQIPFTCGSEDVAAYARERGESIELAARTLRYAFFETLNTKIATAHNADDNLETVLLNLTRGTALRGLGGIPPQRGNIVRPVLPLTRADIEAYLDANSLAYITDSSNADDCFLRNRVRHHITPVLRAENPSLAEKTLALTTQLRQDEAYLQQETAALLSRAASGGGYDAATLAAAPYPLRSRALRTLLEHTHSDLSAAALREADALLTTKNPSAAAAHLGLYRRYALLIVGEGHTPKPFAPFLLPLGGTHPLGSGQTLRCDSIPDYLGGEGLFLVLDAPLTVRTRAPGDCLRLSGGTKSLARLMIDRKIPQSHRAGLPVLTQNGRVIAAVGIGAEPVYKPALHQPCYHIWIERGTNDDS